MENQFTNFFIKKLHIFLFQAINFEKVPSRIIKRFFLLKSQII